MTNLTTATKEMKPNGTDTLVSANEYGGTKVPLPVRITATKEMKPNGTDTLVSANGYGGTDTQGADPVPPPKHRHLPHIDLNEYYQFVTFRTFESVDEFVRKWDFSPAMSNKEKQQAIDDYLDNSTNGVYLKDDVLEWLYDFLLQQDRKLYELSAFAIMNNHVHVLFKPLKPLSKVMQIIKGVSAKEINELLGKSGKFWADDYYDKAIRDEKHFWVVYEYIKNNPLKIGGTEVPLPRGTINGTDTLVSANGYGGVKTSHMKRFYGIFG
jgi:putative transposase